MKSMIHALTLAGFVGSAAALGAGNVSGEVKFTGAKPKVEHIKMDADPVCKKEHTSPVAKGDVVVNGNGTLANVLVYLKDAKAPANMAKPAAMTFDQNGCMYKPHVFGLVTGQTLKIVNSDPTLHNVHALPKSNPSFNMGMATKGQTIEKSFTKPEMAIRIKCDVHGWMNAYTSVFDHPYFAVTDESGKFTIKDVPPGEYTIEAWHEKYGTKNAKVSVTDQGAKAPVDFAFGGQG